MTEQEDCPLPIEPYARNPAEAKYCPYCGESAEKQDGIGVYECTNSGETFFIER